MQKESKLSKIIKCFKKSLIFPLTGVFLFSGCYTSINLSSKKKNGKELHKKSEYVQMDYDGDGIMNSVDSWPYRYGPYVDMNGNGYVDFGDLEIKNSFYNSNLFWYPYNNYFFHYYKNHVFNHHKYKRQIIKYRKRDNIKLRNNSGLRNSPYKRDFKKGNIKKRSRESFQKKPRKRARQK